MLGGCFTPFKKVRVSLTSMAGAANWATRSGELWAAVGAYQSGLGDHWLTTAIDVTRYLEERYADRDLGGYLIMRAAITAGWETGSSRWENSVAAWRSPAAMFSGRTRMPYLTRAPRLESVAALPRQYGLMAAIFARIRLRRPIWLSTASANWSARHCCAVRGDRTTATNAPWCVGTICLAPVSLRPAS